MDGRVNANTLKILAIDDNRDNLTTLRAVMSDSLPGASLVTALDGTTGFELALAEDPDVILLDIVMPGMDGFAVCRKLKQDERLKAIPVIFLTALRTDRESRMRAVDAGAEGFLPKPVDELELAVQIRAMAKIKAANRLRRLEREELAALLAQRTRALRQELEERTQAQEALRESEERHRAILHTAMDGFWLVDRDGRLREVNETYCRMSGYSAPELLAMHVSDLEALEATGDTAAHIRTVMAQGEGRFESRHRRRDGSTFDVEVSVQYRPADGGRLVAFVQDISARKRAEENYRTLFREMLNGFALHEIICDEAGLPADYRFLAVNPAFERMTGLQAEDIVGRTVLDAMPATERHWIETYGRVALTGEPAFFESYAAGLQKHFEVAAFRPAPNQLACIFADISERKAAEAEIDRLYTELERRVVERTARLAAANKDLETFSYSVSHDLRAPLRAISGFASILGRRYRDDLDEKGRHYVDTIAAEGERLGILMEELLDYARLGRRMVRAEPVPLEPLVAQLRATYAEQVAASGGTLEVIEPLAVPQADPVLLERIMVNLVENALTYRRPDLAPHVTLSAVRRDGAVTLSVADNGIGIPPEYREKIFEVFTRLHGPEAYPGTGIGLSIVRRAARLMGSEISLESVEGEGSTFSVELPAAGEPALPAADDSGEPA